MDLKGLVSPKRPWLYLVYSLGLFVPWLFEAPDPPEAVVTFGAYGLFLLGYVVAMRVGGIKATGLAALIALMGFVLMTVTWAAVVFPLFSGAMAARAEDPRLRWGGLGAIGVAVVVAGILGGWPLWLIPVTVLGGAMAAAAAISGFADRRAEDERAALQAQAEAAAADAERRRIARDLHDLLGHSLSVVALKADLADRLWQDDPARARAELAEIRSVSRSALAQVRQAVTGLQLSTLGEALSEARKTLEAAGLSVSLAAETVQLPAHAEQALALAVKEATTNILRHARAASVEIALDHRGEMIRLRIADDGRGSASFAEGNGLSGMRARLEALGGRFDAGGGESGFTVTLELPAAQGEEAAQ